MGTSIRSHTLMVLIAGYAAFAAGVEITDVVYEPLYAADTATAASINAVSGDAVDLAQPADSLEAQASRVVATNSSPGKKPQRWLREISPAQYRLWSQTTSWWSQATFPE
jgi:hypothetical protein